MPPNDPPSLPARIGPYRILGLLGEGSSGRVYLAQESDPPRQIALKVLRMANLGQEALTRFRREATLLARLQHPAIARLYQAGVADTDAGPLPYLAMEYVEGLDLLRHAETHPLDRDARLALMAAISRAIHHAHSRGVIHRDLKPGNILIDADGQPHILDFGVGALIQDDSVGLTINGQILGTLPYMSAEQLAGGRSAGDPRCDIYALGVMSYQLLSGTLPYPGLSDSTVMEAIATLRRERAEPLAKRLPAARGDIDTVVMKAMAAEASQRYPSAAELALDLERISNREPISARPPTAGYLLGLFVRRHRGLSLALAFSALALITGSAMSIRYGLREASARHIEEIRSAQLDASNRFLESIFSAADPELMRSHPPSLHDFLDEARISLDGDHSLSPAARALVARTMSLTYAHSGDVQRGLELIGAARTALAAVPDADAYTREQLSTAEAELLTLAGRYADAQNLLQPLITASPPSEPKARRLWLEARAQNVTATATLGQLQEALALIGPLRADAEKWLGGNDRLSLAIAFQQAELQHQSGDLQGSLMAFEALIPRLAAHLGPYQSYTLQARLAQAAIVRELGDLPRAAALTRSLLEDLDRERGPRNMVTITTRFMLAAVLQSQNPQSAEAVALLRDVLAQYRTQLGNEHHYTLSAMSALAVFLQKQGRHAEALALSGQALEATKRQGFADGPETLPRHNAHALSLMALGRLGEACPRFDNLLARAQKALGATHLQTITYAANDGECQLRARHPMKALAVLEPAYEAARKTLGDTHPQTILTATRLAAAHRALGHHFEADALAQPTTGGRTP